MKTTKSDILQLFFPGGTQLMALPSWNEPRLVFEAGSLRRQWHDSGFLDAYSRKGRARRLFLQTLIPILPCRRLENECIKPAIDSFVEGLAIPYVRKAVIVGRDDSRQKWTVILIGENSKPIAFLKYGEREQARKRITHETKVLATLPEGAGPELLKHGCMGPGVAFVMKPVDGEIINHNHLADENLRRLLDWSKKMTTGAVSINDHPAIIRLREQLAHRMEQPVANRLIPNVSQFEKWLMPLKERTWPVGWQHGDAAPWNFRISHFGQVRAIDWEDAVADGCPFFDLVYYVLQTHYFLRDANRETAFYDSTQWLCSIGLREKEAEALTKLAALNAWLRWKEDGFDDEHPVQQFRMLIAAG